MQQGGVRELTSNSRGALGESAEGEEEIAEESGVHDASLDNSQKDSCGLDFLKGELVLIHRVSVPAGEMMAAGRGRRGGGEKPLCLVSLCGT
jgi:hypothetical protein